MKNMVDIKVILDDSCVDPKISIRTKEQSGRIDNIIDAIENAEKTDYPMIQGLRDDTITLLSQRDIIRVFTRGRKIEIQTDTESYFSNTTLSALEEQLNKDRFMRISQSEIINIYKVRHFKIDIAGTIGIEFENGESSWASRRRVKAIKSMLKKYS